MPFAINLVSFVSSGLQLSLVWKEIMDLSWGKKADVLLFSFYYVPVPYHLCREELKQALAKLVEKSMLPSSAVAKGDDAQEANIKVGK